MPGPLADLVRASSSDRDRCPCRGRSTPESAAAGWDYRRARRRCGRGRGDRDGYFRSDGRGRAKGRSGHDAQLYHRRIRLRRGRPVLCRNVQHGAGFGLGLERMLMYITGMKNIRDVIPFPRVPGYAEF